MLDNVGNESLDTVMGQFENGTGVLDSSSAVSAHTSAVSLRQMLFGYCLTAEEHRGFHRGTQRKTNSDHYSLPNKTVLWATRCVSIRELREEH